MKMPMEGVLYLYVRVLNCTEPVTVQFEGNNFSFFFFLFCGRADVLLFLRLSKISYDDCNF